MLSKSAFPYLLFLIINFPAFGQEHPVDTLRADTIQIRNLKDVFTHGNTEGHARNYFMATRNLGKLSNHYANAIGARLGFHTAPYKGFRAGMAGLFTYNMFSSDLAEKDPVSGKTPRYELELFDIEDTENKADLDRLDELYLEYDNKFVKATIGRFSFTSPLINPQDGRMKPYSAQGISLEIPVKQNTKINLAWLNHFSPRSTVSWYKAGEIIGVFPVGSEENGNPSGYRHHVITTGVAVAGLRLQPVKNLNTEVWNYWLQNVSNITYTRTIMQLNPLWKIGAEGLFQTQVGDGGNPESGLAYFPEQQHWLVGGMIAYEPANWHISANYLNLGANGRFLFPREFGREQFFVTTPRGRLEGLCNADAIALKVRRNLKNNLTAEAALTKTWLPAPNDFLFNKYSAVSYWNGLIDLLYKPKPAFLTGFQFRLLYVARFSPETDLPLEKRFYNTNFHHFNIVTQLTF